MSNDTEEEPCERGVHRGLYNQHCIQIESHFSE